VLFNHTIDGLPSWGKVFCDRDAFAPLVRAIFAREGLGGAPPLAGLTPGSNAVFRAGPYVVKIFAPEESDLGTGRDFEVETAMLRRAATLGLDTPALVAEGEILDRYRFRYLVMAHIDGVEAGGALPGYSPGDKATFARRMRAMLDCLHRPCPGLLPRVDVRARALANPRLAALPPRLQEAFRCRASTLAWPDCVPVHGDVTAENVLIRPDGAPVLIDYADSVIAPRAYELPPLAFDLFRCDRGMVRAYAGSQDIPAFTDDLLDGVCLHQFGPDCLTVYAGRENLSLDNAEGFDWWKAQLVARWG